MHNSVKQAKIVNEVAIGISTNEKATKPKPQN